MEEFNNPLIQPSKEKVSTKAKKMLKAFFWPNSNKALSSIVLGLVFAGLFTGVFYAFALPYSPGETTNPSCSPGDANCTVVASVPYTGATAAVNLGSNNLTTTGTGSFGSITLTTAALTVGNGGTGNSTFTAYGVITGGTTSTGALQQVSGTGDSGQVLTSNGASALPTWEDVTSLPDQTGNSGKFLTTNGSVASWTAALTGSSLILDAAVNQNTAQIKANDNTGFAFRGDNNQTAGVVVASSNILNFNSYGLVSHSDISIGWDSGVAGSGWAGSPDVGLSRNAAGVLRVTNGSTGVGALISGDHTFRYDANNYATLTVASNGDTTITTTSPGSADLNFSLTYGGVYNFGGAGDNDVYFATNTGHGVSGSTNNSTWTLFSNRFAANRATAAFQYGWTDTETYNSLDTGISSPSAGAIKITDGSTGLGTLTSGNHTIGYDVDDYATLSTASNGDVTLAATSATDGGQINLNSDIAGDSTILTTSGTLVLGGSGGASNNENLKLDFETYADKVAVTSSTGVTDLDLGSLNIATTGSLTMGGSTAGTLVTRVKAGAATESDANGSLVIDSSNARLYFRYGGAWHYVAQTAGFQIPDFETTDPISGDPINEGDIVLGMINNTLSDGALHGVWVKWSSVKEELLAEARGELANFQASSSSGEGSSSTTATFADKVKNVLTSVGVKFTSGVASIKDLVADRFTAKIARVDKMEMVDTATGDIYCTWFEGGVMKNGKGECNSTQVAVAGSQLSQEIKNVVDEAAQAAASQAAEQAAQEAVEQVSDEIQQEVQEQVQVEVEQQVQQEVQQQVEAEVQEQIEEVLPADSMPGNSGNTPAADNAQPEVLFDVLTLPLLGESSTTKVFLWSTLLVLALLFILYRIDRRRLLKKIEEVKHIKDLP